MVVSSGVTNGKSESVTIMSSMATLMIGDKSYDVDSDGDIALMLDGGKTFFLKDLGPDVTTSGQVVFDIPKASAKKKLEVCFGELGFGDSKGCIALKPKAASCDEVSGSRRRPQSAATGAAESVNPSYPAPRPVAGSPVAAAAAHVRHEDARLAGMFAPMYHEFGTV